MPKFFYTHELQKNGDIEVQQVRSCDNPVDILTKSLPTSTFEKLRSNMGMWRLKGILHQYVKLWDILFRGRSYSFSFVKVFIPMGLSLQGFNEATNLCNNSHLTIKGEYYNISNCQCLPDYYQKTIHRVINKWLKNCSLY